MTLTHLCDSLHFTGPRIKRRTLYVDFYIFFVIAQSSEDIWGKYHDEWQKLSSEDTISEHPWVSEFTDQYSPYKVITTPINKQRNVITYLYF